MSRCFLSVSVLFLLVTSCACVPREVGDFRVLNPEEIPGGKAVIYLFRPPSIIDESAVCNTMVGELLVGGLKPGDYTVVFADPGKTRIETVGTAPAFVTIHVNEGSEYFVRQAWHLRGGKAQPALDHLPKLKSKNEIQFCSFIEDPAPAIDAVGEHSEENEQ